MPLAAPLAALALGLAAARWIDFTSRELLIAIAVLAAIAFAALRWSTSRAAKSACLAAFAFAGALLVTVHRPSASPTAVIDPYETILIAGCVTSPVQLTADHLRFELELEPKARAAVSLYRKPGDHPPTLRYGDSVEFEGRARSPRNYQNSGAFDYVTYLERRYIYWNVSASAGTSIDIRSQSCGHAVLGWIYRLRTALDERITATFTDSFAQGMARALMLGDSTGIEEVWKDAFRRTGTYHALVVSGMHLTALAGVLLLFLRVLSLPQTLAFSLTILVGWIYALLTGFAMPVIRAAAGLSLYLVGRFLYRRTRPLNFLAAIALILFVCDPGALWDPSFQLSFLAVAAIVAIAMPIAEATTAPLRKGLASIEDSGPDLRKPPSVAQARIELRLIAETLALATRLPLARITGVMHAFLLFPLYWLELFLLSFSVQLGLALPMIIYFHRLSISGLIANLLLVPVLNIALPITALAALAGFGPAQSISTSPLHSARSIVEMHAAWEPEWRIASPPLWLGAAAAIALASAPFLWSRGRRWRIASLTLGAACLALLLTHPFPPEIQRGRLSLTAIDVGQGDALMTTFPDGQVMLLDAGGFPPIGGRTPGIDTGEDIVAPYLWSQSIKRVDILAMSHPQNDHIGGLPALLRIFRPRELWIGGMPPLKGWLALYDEAARTQTEIVVLYSGAEMDVAGTKVRVLHPAPGGPDKNPNNDSLVLELSYGRRRFLLTGDMEKQVETDLIDQGKLRPVDVLKVAHHGSRTSSTEAFLEAIHPKWALLSVGYANRHRHPHPLIVERFADHKIPLLRTDQHGLSTISTDGSDLQIKTEAWQLGYPSKGPVF